ncbi:hypothetical protein ASF08_07665 [Methylobacterium sp. Leaf85]|nr:hypothetical protein ASF08_07665 [Methylobacterium sp. Leaf85]
MFALEECFLRHRLRSIMPQVGTAVNVHPRIASPAVDFEDFMDTLRGRLTEIGIAYDRKRRLLITTLMFRDRPCFSLQLLRDYRALCDGLADFMVGIPFEARPVRFLLHTSGEPGIWCLGGDLDLFVRCIREGDHETLRDYGYECIHSGYISHTGLGLSVVTLCLVQGQALGGGFESARSCNFLFAEEQSRFGLPEMKFNMFPGMGAYSYIAERIGMRRTEDMVLKAGSHTAHTMYDMGAVDYVVSKGEGIRKVRAFVDLYGEKFNGLASMMEARRLSMRIDLDSMHRVVDTWVDCAFRIGSTDLKRMERLVAAQRQRRQRASTTRTLGN